MIILLVGISVRNRMVRSENEVDQERQLFYDAINGLPGIFYLFNQQGQMIRWNRSFEQISGYSHGEISQRHPIDYFRGDDRTRIANAIQTTFQEGYVQVEALFTPKNGEQIPFLFTGRRVEMNGDLYIVGLGVDIRERKAAEEKAFEAERLQLELEQVRQSNMLKSRFMTLVSHEFRTPLTIIQNSAQMLQRYWQRMDDNQRNTHVHKIIKHIDSIDALMSDFSAAIEVDASQQELVIEEFNIVSVIQQICDDLQHARGNSHIIDIVNDLRNPTMTQSRRLLSHIIRNLFDNAMKYSPAGSTIHCRLSHEKDNIRIDIQDHGMGIPEDEKEKLFQPYFRGRDVGEIRGTGLGLKIVYDSIKAMCGKITLTSQQQHGTTFHILIPVRLPASVDQPA